ncbi:chaperonin 10-like protein [Dendryphion nanum]|uniref:Chaperonin 10-like protein n=1 Tax=Dendryphion nanum TaxID=256645 RepID=A0A9P9DUZ0_9PLEO|nr:chaperonin 10-like protein [Dendryphion nanum]
MTTPPNRAAYLTATSSTELDIQSAPYTRPSKNEIVIRARAIAVNPVDKAKQAMGSNMFPWIKYPFVIGDDVAGDVVEVGPGVTRFKVGDRVLGNAVGIDKRSNRSCEGAFQEYVVLRTNLASHIPDTLPYENASVLPLCLSTAACGLFTKDCLALEFPQINSKKNSTGKTLLVWGGSTAVGSNAIQLAIAAGYEVIATASPKNFDYVTKLGATKAFDYNSPTAVADIITAFKGKTSAGAIAIGQGSLEACIDIVAATHGRKFVAQASVPAPTSLPPKGLALISFIAYYFWFNVSTSIKSKIKGVGTKFIWSTDLMENEVGSVIYEHFLPDALATEQYKAAPEPQVIGTGLEYIQEALDTVIKGVSAKKIVVRL